MTSKNQSKKAKGEMRGKTKTYAILLVSLSALLAAFGQVLYKLAIIRAHGDMLIVLFSPLLYTGLFIYFISALIMITSLKMGELSTLFPFMSSSFIWVSVFSKIILRETFPALRWVGVFVILMGLIILGVGGGE